MNQFSEERKPIFVKRRMSGTDTNHSGSSQSAGSSIVLDSQSADPAITGQSATNRILTELRNMRSSFGGMIEDINTRVDELSEKVNNPPPSTAPSQIPESTPARRHWADDDSTAQDRPLVGPHCWNNSDDEDGDCQRAVIKLSEEDEKLVRTVFSSTLPNAERRRLRNSYPTTGLPQTKCPRLDPVFKSSLASKTDTKAIDSELARAQAFILDPIGPLTYILGKLESDQGVSSEELGKTLRESITLLGNASSQISRTRRKRVLKTLNPKMQDMAEEQELFGDSAPNLFGNGFESKMKERSDSLRILEKSSGPPPAKKRQFFRQSHPTGPQRGGGSANRGGSYRSRNYHNSGPNKNRQTNN